MAAQSQEQETYCRNSFFSLLWDKRFVEERIYFCCSLGTFLAGVMFAEVLLLFQGTSWIWSKVFECSTVFANRKILEGLATVSLAGCFSGILLCYSFSLYRGQTYKRKNSKAGALSGTKPIDPTQILTDGD